MQRKSFQQDGTLPHYISNGFPKEMHDYFQSSGKEEATYVRYPFWKNVLRKIAGLCLFPYTVFKTNLINSDEVGLMVDGNGQPQLLGPGWHTLFHPMSRLIKIQKQTDPYIAVSSLKVINVKGGEVCYCTDSHTGKQILLTAGRHFLTSPSIVYRGFINLNTPEELYDPSTGAKTPIGDNDLKIIRIETAEQGIISQRGEYKILQTGLHVIIPPDKYMSKIKTSQEAMKLGMLEVNSKDLVKLRIDADVFYRIQDPLKAITTIGKDFAKFIQEKAKAVLNMIIRDQSYMHAGQARTEKTKLQGEGNDTASVEQIGIATLRPMQNIQETKETPIVNFTNFTPDMTAQSIHDQFIGNIKHDLKEHGIEISDIRIESMEIADTQLARDLASQASASAKTQTEVFNLNAQAIIQQQKAVNEGRMKEIQAQANATITRAAAEAEAFATKQKADANAYAIKAEAAAKKDAQILNEGRMKEIQAQANATTTRVAAEAEAFATKQKADANAYAIKTEATAKKDAQILEAEGMEIYGQHLANSPIAQQLAITKAQVAPLSKATNIQLTQFPDTMRSLFAAPAAFFSQNSALSSRAAQENKVIDSQVVRKQSAQ